VVNQEVLVLKQRAMFKNYIKLAFRSLGRNRAFTFINIFGLATGLTCCLLISMYLFKEFSYDRHQEHRDRLYQLQTLSTKDGIENRASRSPAPMVTAMQMEFPEIESTTRLIDAFEDDKTLLQWGEGRELTSFYETDGYFADSTFFRMFSYKFKEGNGTTALNEPNSVVLSEEIAHKIFGVDLL
jgi:putative ABC transport system permease protein